MDDDGQPSTNERREIDKSQVIRANICDNFASAPPSRGSMRKPQARLASALPFLEEHNVQQEMPAHS
jgi:hypothetical protein